MKIQDFIHLYYGCKYQWEDSGGFKVVSPIDSDAIAAIEKYPNICRYLLLRPLSDMTEAELFELLKFNEHVYRGGSAREFVVGWKAFGAQTFIYLLSRGFDLFNLIPEGLALDKTLTEKTV